MAFNRTNGPQIRDTPAACHHFWSEAISNEKRFHPYSTLVMKRSISEGMDAARSVYSESFYSSNVENYHEKLQDANCIIPAGKPTRQSLHMRMTPKPF
jgi:hypothetical protein